MEYALDENSAVLAASCLQVLLRDLPNCLNDNRVVEIFIHANKQQLSVMVGPEVAYASDIVKINEMFEIGELFDLGIQLLYLLLLLGLLGVGTYFVIRQVLVRRELDLSAKELQRGKQSRFLSAKRDNFQSKTRQDG